MPATPGQAETTLGHGTTVPGACDIPETRDSFGFRSRTAGVRLAAAPQSAQVFCTTIEGNFELMSFALSAIRTATRRAILR